MIKNNLLKGTFSDSESEDERDGNIFEKQGYILQVKSGTPMKLDEKFFFNLRKLIMANLFFLGSESSEFDNSRSVCTEGFKLFRSSA